MNGETARKLLDNGWQILLFRDGMGSYTAIACKENESVDVVVKRWREYEAIHPFDGPNRYAGCGFSINKVIEAVTEKVLFNRLPGMTTEECLEGLSD